MSMLKKLGAASAAILKTIMGPQVGKNDICDAIGYVTNAGAPSSVVPDFIGQTLFDTSGSQFYIAYGVASGEWSPMGDNTLSVTELAFLDGALSTNAVASKAAILGTDKVLNLSGALNNTAGAGITGGTGTIFKTAVERVGGIVKTSILVDLTGAASSTTDLDIIGQGASAAHLGQITAALNGTLILAGKITCLEVPAGGVTDIDVYYATEATGVFDDNFGALTETVLLTQGGAWTLALQKAFADPVGLVGKYIYLACGAAGTPGTYTAGKFLIELFGYDA